MSGVDVSDKQKENQVHVCESCMNTVVQTFGHMQKQIAELKRQKTKLELEHEKKIQSLVYEIKALEEKLATLRTE